MRITVTAPAKINITLDILGKRADGYHVLKMVMQSVSLSDTVTVWNEDDGKISVTCNADSVPCDDSNIAARAAREFFSFAGIENPGIGIKIKKRIPVAAGLAGGSADGAAVLLALNELFSTGFSASELCEPGLKVGADIPFCLLGGTMLAEGTGGILTPLPDLAPCHIVLVKPKQSVSTKEAYTLADTAEILRHPDTDDVVEAICGGDLKAVGAGLCNVFEQVIKLDEIDEIKSVMLGCGALGACMSGSGPSVFGIFDDKGAADDCLNELVYKDMEAYICSPESRGCRVED